MPAPTLVMQTTYAELLDRSAASAFQDDFPDDGTFVPKTAKGRRYWYFQQSSKAGREQKYVGPETPELLKRISEHKQVREDERERRSLVSTLVRSFRLTRPPAGIGAIVSALAKAGVFRLRGVLVGTIAYQTYPALLGTRLPLATLHTADVDIAQFKNISVAVEDQTPPVLDVLREVDSTFRPVPNVHSQSSVTSYVAKGGIRVDFLTPNEGPDSDAPEALPALRTDAEPLRFLDFLIHDPEPAVILHGSGVYVLVPAPERYAVHKLIVSRRRKQRAAKSDKDLHQAAALVTALVEKRPHELKSAWDEAFARGKGWRKLLLEGTAQLPSLARDLLLKAVEQRRMIIPGLALTFSNPAARYDSNRDIVAFVGTALGATIQCAISREAIDDHFGPATSTDDARLEAFRKNRSTIERLASIKYLRWPVAEPNSILIKTAEISALRKDE